MFGFFALWIQTFRLWNLSLDIVPGEPRGAGGPGTGALQTLRVHATSPLAVAEAERYARYQQQQLADFRPAAKLEAGKYLGGSVAYKPNLQFDVICKATGAVRYPDGSERSSTATLF